MIGNAVVDCCLVCISCHASEIARDIWKQGHANYRGIAVTDGCPKEFTDADRRTRKIPTEDYRRATENRREHSHTFESKFWNVKMNAGKGPSQEFSTLMSRENVSGAHLLCQAFDVLVS
eukprot:Gb_05532 [translate_table: standard]